MQAPISTRTPDAPMTLPAVCLFSEAFVHRSISTGKERDSESGNDYFGARYYASSMGRMMSPDPANAGADPSNPQSWNMYSYALNNPLIITDPTGLDPCPQPVPASPADGDKGGGASDDGGCIEIGRNRGT
jgi:RHS repeat-associated protein